MERRFMVSAIKHAELSYPKESCGVVVGGKYTPIRNDATTPEEHFVFNTQDYKEALLSGEVEYVIHSHPNTSSNPSDADRLGCEESGVPWIIISVGIGADGSPAYHDHKEFSPNGWEAPLIGRDFSHGVLDCLTIVLDYYKRERGIDLGHFEREDGWWDNGKDYYRELLPKAGFVEVDSLQQGDVVLMQIRAPVPNHAAIYLEDGVLETEDCHATPHSILHHLYGRQSCRDVYGGFWQEKTVSIWRYRGGDYYRTD